MMRRLQWPAYPKANRNRGFSLIEVLVAVLVMAIGMLGIAALQSTALRNNQSAFQRGQAVIHSYTIIDSMRANRRLVGDYASGDFLCAAPEETSLATRDLAGWITSIQDTLGDQACGKVDCVFPASGNPNDPHLCTIEVRWDDSRGSGVAADLEDFTVVTRALL